MVPIRFRPLSTRSIWAHSFGLWARAQLGPFNISLAWDHLFVVQIGSIVLFPGFLAFNHFSAWEHVVVFRIGNMLFVGLGAFDINTT